MKDTPAPSTATLSLLDECAAAVREHRRGYARITAAVTALARSNAVSETGHRSLGRLLEEHVRLDRGDARRLVTHAGLLADPAPGPLAPADPELPTTARAVAAGAVSPEHVTVIAAAVSRLRLVPLLPVPVVDEAERQLAGLALERSPRQLTHDAAEILLRHDPDGEAPHDSDRPVEELRMHTGRDGTLRGRFHFADPERAQTVRQAIEARTPPPDPEADTTALHPGRELHERHAEALHDLAVDAGAAEDEDEEAADDRRLDEPIDGLADQGPDDLGPDDPGPDQNLHPPDDLFPLPGEPAPSRERPAAGGNSPRGDSAGGSQRRRPRANRRAKGAGRGRDTTLLVTVSLDVLEKRARDTAVGWQGFALLDGQWAVSPETARRLACDAAVVPVVLGSRGEVLDVGRKTRIVSAAQRRAVIARDRHCAHPGCRRPARRCDVHHVRPWAQDGVTDLDNLVLICPYHHHQVHHSGWQIDMRDGVPWFVPPAWLDPLRTLRTNHVERLVAA